MPCSVVSFDSLHVSGRSAAPFHQLCLPSLRPRDAFSLEAWARCPGKMHTNSEDYLLFEASSGAGLTITVPFMPALSWIVHT